MVRNYIIIIHIISYITLKKKRWCVRAFSQVLGDSCARIIYIIISLNHFYSVIIICFAPRVSRKQRRPFVSAYVLIRLGTAYHYYCCYYYMFIMRMHRVVSSVRVRANSQPKALIPKSSQSAEYYYIKIEMYKTILVIKLKYCIQTYITGLNYFCIVNIQHNSVLFYQLNEIIHAAVASSNYPPLFMITLSHWKGVFKIPCLWRLLYLVPQL